MPSSGSAVANGGRVVAKGLVRLILCGVVGGAAGFALGLLAKLFPWSSISVDVEGSVVVGLLMLVLGSALMEQGILIGTTFGVILALLSFFGVIVLRAALLGMAYGLAVGTLVGAIAAGLLGDPTLVVTCAALGAVFIGVAGFGASAGAPQPDISRGEQSGE